MNYINNVEICVSALQRSGHHAIINWIISNSSSSFCFLNNCLPHHNPFFASSGTDSLVQHISIENERIGNFSEKNLIIFNYEDKELSDIFYPTFNSEKQHWLGPSKKQFNILILRDPFNNIASKYRWAKEGTKWKPSIDSLNQVVNLWKAYAREYLNDTDFIKENKIAISYNQWFSDSAYRHLIGEKLQLSSIDKGLTEIAKWGPNTWGDSFDNLTFDGKANKMKVFDRWKFYMDDPFFLSLFDKETIELSNKIFGPLISKELISKINKNNETLNKN